MLLAMHSLKQRALTKLIFINSMVTHYIQMFAIVLLPLQNSFSYVRFVKILITPGSFFKMLSLYLILVRKCKGSSCPESLTSKKGRFRVNLYQGDKDDD